MNRIKSFSELSASDIPLSESASDTPVFTTKIGSWGSRSTEVYVELYKEPLEIKGANVIGGSVQWSMDIERTKWGYEISQEGASIKSLTMTIEMEDPVTGDYKETTAEFSEEQFNPELIRTEIHEFPLELNTIEITMNGSSNPKNWNITLNIGKISV